MKTKLFFLSIIVAALTLPTVSFAQTDDFDLEYGPWVTNLTESSFDVLLTTSKDVFTWVEVDIDGQTQCYYQVVAGRRSYGRSHDIHVSGLKAGQTYSYRIRGREVVDDVNPYKLQYGRDECIERDCQITTLDCAKDACRFVVVNDIHFNDEAYRTLTRDMQGQDFLVLNGDIVSYNTCIDSTIKHITQPIESISRHMPIYYVRGNHETRGREAYKFPGLFPTPTGEAYYTFRQGPVAFIVLNGGEDKPDGDREYFGMADFDAYRSRELLWLQQAVQDPNFKDAPQKVCLMHIPTAATDDAWYSQLQLCELFMPVLNEAGIDLMISAHLHEYVLYPAGSLGNAYPIFVNDNCERLEVIGTAESLSLRSYDTDGHLTHSLDL